MTDIKVSMAVSIKSKVFRFLTPCPLSIICHRFEGALFIQQFQAVREEILTLKDT
jgi:hypothetical protein